MHIFNHISEDLQQTQQLLKKNMTFRAGHLSSFALVNPGGMDLHLRPGIVICAGRIFGPASSQLVALAAVLQFIYLAFRVHTKVKDSSTAKERPVDNRSGIQYPVLVGDYLYGKSSMTLCQFGLTRYMKDLAELVCHMSKSGIKALREPGAETPDRQSYVDVVRGETALLFACGAYLGADLAGADEAAKNKLYNFGLNLGMAYGLLERGATTDQVVEYLGRAEINLAGLPENDAVRSFRELITLLSEDNTVQRMVG